MTNQLYAAGPFDGTTIGAAFGSMPTTFLLQPHAVRFDPTKINWVGNTNRETNVAYVWHTAKAQSLGELATKELMVGAQSPGTSQFDFPVVANHVLGFKFKVVTGYDSTPKIHLAMEQGEIEGNAATSWTTLKALNANWLAEKKVKVIAQWALRKHAELADVPLVLDLAKTDADRQALLLVLARLEFGRPFFLPPNVPAERVAAIRRAFDDTMKDPAFRAEAERLKIDVDPTGGAEMAALVEQVSRTPAETVARVRAALAAR
jgi:tripartite-type tricarboxylate transporter receptor subunit TctC